MHAQSMKALFLLRISTIFPLLSSWGIRPFFRGGDAAVRNATIFQKFITGLGKFITAKHTQNERESLTLLIVARQLPKRRRHSSVLNYYKLDNKRTGQPDSTIPSLLPYSKNESFFCFFLIFFFLLPTLPG